MYDLYESVGDNDLAKERQFTLKNGFNVTIKANDPYGFWTIHFEKGRPPKDISGTYTDYSRAKEALDNYLVNGSYFKKEIAAQVETKKEQEELDAKKRSKSS